MFSEYASRFLAQSQLEQSGTRNSPNRHRSNNSASQRFPGSRSHTQRPTMPTPYQPSASYMSRFPFASRTSAAPAPLFYSATDEFREEDDAEEHERELADRRALEKSRVGAFQSQLTESSELDDGPERRSGADHDDEDEGSENDPPPYRFGRGIKSSWKGSASFIRDRPTRPLTSESIREGDERTRSEPDAEGSEPSSKGKGKLVDVELASTLRDSVDAVDRSEVPQSPEEEADDYPPAFQQFRRPLGSTRPDPLKNTLPLPRETDEETILGQPRPFSPDRETVPDVVSPDPSEPPRHDPFWAHLFLISLAAMFGTSFLVYLHTSKPGKVPLGDTIYSTLHKSFHLLAIDTFVSILVAMLWYSLLKSFVRPLIYLIVIAFPIVSSSFFMYPFISSFQGSWKGDSFQDRAMRWFSVLPMLGTICWIFTVWQARRSLAKAADILEFACRVQASSPALLLLGFGTLFTVVTWTWIWMLMFTRVFLGGHFNKDKSFFIINAGTWWLGIFSVLEYLWVGSVISGIQRATTAATVSQWYFHRNTVPAPSSRVVVKASLVHATTTLLGTICLSTLVSLAVRLPLLILPRRLAGFFTMCFYSWIPTPLAALTNPLTLTYAAIHSQPLSASARGVSQMPWISKTTPTTTLGPGSFGDGGQGDMLQPYRLAKLLLHATRFMMSIGLGFVGWVATARMLEINGTRGSLYAYVVGLIASAIGWGVFGSMEGLMGGVVDAVVVCWGSEVGNKGFGEARYCREAGELFGERGRF